LALSKSPHLILPLPIANRYRYHYRLLLILLDHTLADHFPLVELHFSTLEEDVLSTVHTALRHLRQRHLLHLPPFIG